MRLANPLSFETMKYLQFLPAFSVMSSPRYEESWKSRAFFRPASAWWYVILARDSCMLMLASGLILSAFLIAVGLCYIALADRIGKKIN